MRLSHAGVGWSWAIGWANEARLQYHVSIAARQCSRRGEQSHVSLAGAEFHPISRVLLRLPGRLRRREPTSSYQRNSGDGYRGIDGRSHAERDAAAGVDNQPD
jgi:hypothetical protein